MDKIIESELTKTFKVMDEELVILQICLGGESNKDKFGMCLGLISEYGKVRNKSRISQILSTDLKWVTNSL